ncbi:MAG: serine/threonine-protein kinase [Myxococcota bacterium]
MRPCVDCGSTYKKNGHTGCRTGSRRTPVTVESFGQYRLLECIGAGGMADVFRAVTTERPGPTRRTQQRTGCGEAVPLVALKRLYRHLAADSMFTAMFADEARIATELDHPNIARVLDFGYHDGQHYMALEHIHGRDVRSIFRLYSFRGMPVPLAQACYIAIEACAGLDYAHNYVSFDGRPLKVVHRDISPQNLLLSFDGELKVIDFGIAKATGRVATTANGWIKGKMRYMAPEQMRGMPLDHRADLFSLGVVLFELVTGQRLFPSDDTMEIVRRIHNAEVPRPSSINPDLPPAIDRIILTALSESPDQRFKSASEFADALMAVVQHQGYYMSRNQIADWMKDVYAEEYAAERAHLAQLWSSGTPPAQPVCAGASVDPGRIGRAATMPAMSIDSATFSDSDGAHSGTLVGWTPARASGTPRAAELNRALATANTAQFAAFDHLPTDSMNSARPIIDALQGDMMVTLEHNMNDLTLYGPGTPCAPPDKSVCLPGVTSAPTRAALPALPESLKTASVAPQKAVPAAGRATGKRRDDSPGRTPRNLRDANDDWTDRPTRSLRGSGARMHLPLAPHCEDLSADLAGGQNGIPSAAIAAEGSSQRSLPSDELIHTARARTAWERLENADTIPEERTEPGARWLGWPVLVMAVTLIAATGGALLMWG